MAINSKQKSNESQSEKPKTKVKIKPVGPLGQMLNRSLFAKIFTACSSVMVISFLVLGTALTVLSIRYSNSSTETIFQNTANKISNLIVRLASYNIPQFANEYFPSVLQLSAGNLDASIYICDDDGDIIQCYEQRQDVNSRTSDTISKSVMSAIVKNRSHIKEIGTLGGLFNTSHTCVGEPIISSDGKDVEGAVFICATIGGFGKIIGGIIKIFIFCVCLIIILAFVAIYFVTSRLVRPLRQMSSAAHSFSKGDFSARVPVSSEDEIGQLAVGFNNMAASLASLEEMRSSFVANVSHELKTPMTSISGFIDGILDGTIPPEKENQYLKIVSDEVKRLSRLVRSFLDISRIEAGELKVNQTEFDVMEMIRRVIVGFEQLITEKSLDIRGLDNDNKFMVFADFDMIYQIVYNLVDNAVKFAGNGGYIEINVAAKSKKVYISVKNSGMGIPAADLPYVFDRFYKTDKSRSRDRKGVGLGLYIVKTELNMQGQDISVKSVEGEFCEFVFTLKEA